MRTRAGAIGAGLLMLTACATDRPAPAAPPPAPLVTAWPAAVAGGACRLLDYAVIERITGTRFDVSAARRHRHTQTCVVRSKSAARPDLALSVTATSADASVFKAEVVPNGAKTVKGLGTAGYRVTVPAGKDHGAGVEVGWLTDDGRLIDLRYTLARGADKKAAEALAPQIVELARALDVGGR